MIQVVKADHKNLKDLVPLFDAYRIFYQQLSDKKKAETFLTKRLENKESIVFIAYKAQSAIGFVQLFPTFSSVSLESFYILNDLFVSPKFRGIGIGEKLLKEAKKHCSLLKYKGLALETAKENPAQHLYEKLGWVKDEDFLHYFWKCPKSE
ncbi:GNAT family N-acetyltransferase [Croceitalea vernalis]|uniref:GNAT family N-acetyltransferase n=1 Tax=Croceitalea vernalis TaxID=3075599 RepID=A0ABU3BI57_9FLAO|nr:GNAT family N-acetyltransferase [Croceitalea sp. P007]MDT0621828.1 GNAT family N-acetyltransferase [Croceitalea sp. P007]